MYSRRLLRTIVSKTFQLHNMACNHEAHHIFTPLPPIGRHANAPSHRTSLTLPKLCLSMFPRPLRPSSSSSTRWPQPDGAGNCKVAMSPNINARSTTMASVSRRQDNPRTGIKRLPLCAARLPATLFVWCGVRGDEAPRATIKICVCTKVCDPIHGTLPLLRTDGRGACVGLGLHSKDSSRYEGGHPLVSEISSLAPPWRWSKCRGRER